MFQKAEELLKEYFGYTSFRKGQEDIIKNLLADNDTLAIMPTGGGSQSVIKFQHYYWKGLRLLYHR